MADVKSRDMHIHKLKNIETHGIFKSILDLWRLIISTVPYHMLVGNICRHNSLLG